MYNCPVELALDVIGGKWRAVLLAHLKQRPHHYGELRRKMPGISEKMFGQRLRELQDAGLVSRTEVPPYVEYALTEEGRSLGPALQALYDWGLERAARTGEIIAPPDSARADRHPSPHDL